MAETPVLSLNSINCIEFSCSLFPGPAAWMSTKHSIKSPSVFGATGPMRRIRIYTSSIAPTTVSFATWSMWGSGMPFSFFRTETFPAGKSS